MGTTVCILCYGDYPEVSGRCLTSLLKFADWPYITEVRLGVNQVGAQTAAAVDAFCRESPVPVRVYRPATNPGKYPIMRRMLYDYDRSLTSKLVTWFDDDSYLNGTSGDVFRRLTQRSGHLPLQGAQYSIWLRGGQAAWLKRQPWCVANKIATPYRVRFVNGGFWTANIDFLHEHNYPWPELHHNGGDVFLGELHKQQRKTIGPAVEGVCVNADHTGAASSAPRRGLDTTPLGVNYTDGQVLSTAHQNFEMEVEQHAPT